MTTSDVVFFTLFRSDQAYSSISLSMSKVLARDYRVFYIQHPYTWWDVFKGWLKKDPAVKRHLSDLLLGRTRYESFAGIPARFVVVHPPAVLPINWLPAGFLFRFFHRINERRVLKAVSKVLKDFEITSFIYINCYNPFYAGVLPQKMGASMHIYHCIDDISQNQYTAKHGFELEKKAIQSADLTLVTSTQLLRLKEGFSNRVALFFNAADVSLFEKVHTERYPVPTVLEGRTGKVIGFIGNLDELRIDYPLLKKIAMDFPQHTLLLVGPLNSEAPQQIGMDRLPNIVWAGSRRLEELPPLLQYMDAVLIPFLCNTLTKSIYPLKINEYLAAGKPVVSTAFSEDIKGFSEWIYLAENEEQFMQQLILALAEDAPDKRQARQKVARQNSWEARIQTLRILCQPYLEIK